MADAKHQQGTASEGADARECSPARREVGPEDEERKTPGGPQSQVAPDVEPAGS